MNRVFGRGGLVLLLSDPTSFVAPLVDVDSGFEWACADRWRSWWEPDISFERFAAGWASERALETDLPRGRVSFGRSLRGSQVRVRGSCRPLSEAATVGSWGLSIPASGDAHCDLDGWLACVPELVAGEVACVLPLGPGAMRGRGMLQEPVAGRPLRVTFGKKEVSYGPRF